MQRPNLDTLFDLIAKGDSNISAKHIIDAAIAVDLDISIQQANTMLRVASENSNMKINAQEFKDIATRALAGKDKPRKKK